MEKAQRYLASYFVSSFLLSISLFLLCLFISHQLVEWLHVPDHLAKDTQTAFILGGLLFMLNFVMSGIGAAPFYANKLYVSSVGQAIQMFLRALMIVILFTWTTPAIWHIPLAAVLGSLAAMGIGIYYFKNSSLGFRLSGGMSRYRLVSPLFDQGSGIHLSKWGFCCFYKLIY